MKKFLLVFCLIFTLPSFAACQPSVVENYTQQFMTQFERKVELTADQKTAITEALKSNISDREDIIMSYQGQKGMKVKRELQTQLQAVNATLQSQAKDILTPEQYSAFLDVQSQNQALVKERIKEQF